MNSIIRAYRHEDLADVLATWESASKVAHPFLTEQFLEQERHNIPNVYLPNAETWVAEKDGQVIGFIALIGEEVGALFIKSEFHRMGIGHALMDKARELRDMLEVEFFKKTKSAETSIQDTGSSHWLNRSTSKPEMHWCGCDSVRHKSR